MKIRTMPHEWPPRYKMVTNVWSAVDEDDDDKEDAPMGWGRTEEEAIAHLKAQQDELKEPTFRIGQKVRCVDAWFGPVDALYGMLVDHFSHRDQRDDRLRKGAIYTVSDVATLTTFEEGISLAEVKSKPFCKWEASRFRPVEDDV